MQLVCWATVVVLVLGHPLGRETESASAPGSLPSSPASRPSPLRPDPPPTMSALSEGMRRKRNVLQTVPITHAEEIGMCRFVVQKDTDPQRIPQTIYTVTCRQTGCQCGSEGDYRCTQLTTEVRVSYSNGAMNQVLYPNSGCICAAKEASDALSALPHIAP